MTDATVSGKGNEYGDADIMAALDEARKAALNLPGRMMYSDVRDGRNQQDRVRIHPEYSSLQQPEYQGVAQPMVQPTVQPTVQPMTQQMVQPTVPVQPQVNTPPETQTPPKSDSPPVEPIRDAANEDTTSDDEQLMIKRMEMFNMFLDKNFLKYAGQKVASAIGDMDLPFKKPIINSTAALLGFSGMKQPEMKIPIFIPRTNIAFWVGVSGTNLIAIKSILDEIATSQTLSTRAWLAYYNHILSRIGSTNLVSNSVITVDTWRKILPATALPLLEAGVIQQSIKTTSPTITYLRCPSCGHKDIPSILSPNSITCTPDGTTLTKEYINSFFANINQPVTLESIVNRVNKRDDVFDSREAFESGTCGYAPEYIALPKTGHICFIDVPTMQDIFTSWLHYGKPIDLTFNDHNFHVDTLNLFTSLRNVKLRLETPNGIELVDGRRDPAQTFEIIKSLPQDDLSVLVTRVKEYFKDKAFVNLMKNPKCPNCFEQIAPADITNQGLQHLIFFLQN